jgi:regulation of enolase protein 1 (concanavalin A-like superfamily)
MMTTITLPNQRERFQWAHAPARWSLDDGLELKTQPDTDYWQRTHYGFQRDNGHFYFTAVRGDFTASTQLVWSPVAQYDQCGLLVRADSQTWAKCSVEYETAEHSRLGSVVTNLGYSDWATQDLSGLITGRWYRIRR